MGKSNIEWTDMTWNPVTGCTQISAGCKNCYAKKMANRFKGMGLKKYRNNFEVTCHPDALDKPLGWTKPQRAFVCSMGDLFHEDVPDDFIQKVWAVLATATQHTYLILTKRPERMFGFVQDRINKGWGPACRNVYLGVSVEDQATADERIPLLLQAPAAKRFVSYEPALGPVDFSSYLPHKFNREPHCPWCEDCIPNEGVSDHWKQIREDNHGPFLDQIIMGGETGPGARPMHPDWARSVRDQCKEAGVPFFFKQWGEYLDVDDMDDVVARRYYDRYSYGRCSPHLIRRWQGGKWLPPGDGWIADPITDQLCMLRVGKKDAGHLLDGKEHRERI
jgi:protein gp37